MPTVLLIEDEGMLRANVARALSRMPDVTVVDTGSLEDAIPHLDRRPPDVVVSDIDLPRRTGIEILGELAARRLRIPVIFVTGYLRAYGAQIPRHEDVDILEKPIAFEDLRAAVARRLAPRTSMRPVAPFGVPDYMQLSGMGRHSVVIEVVAKRGHLGSVTMVDGEAWAAHDEVGKGTEALRRLAFVDGAVVSCRSLGTEVPGPRNLDASWEWVLLEAARAHDERRETIGPTDAPESVREESTASENEGPEPSSGEAFARRAFERAFDDGIGALLRKDYVAAMQAFVTAREFDPDDAKVRANIGRLVQMGIALPAPSAGDKEVRP